MKHYKCPHCFAQQSGPEYSLYSILDCTNCGNEYRLADAIHYEGVGGSVRRWWTNLWSPYETGPETSCPYCFGPLELLFGSDGSFVVPDQCRHCGRILPGSVAAKPKPVSVPEPPKPEPPKPVPVPEPPKPVPVPEPPKLTGHYKDIYRKAVEENGGKDLTDAQFRELLKRL